MIVWKRAISLPISCTLAGQSVAKRAGSSSQPVALM
jgi:hypothetical protein